MSTSNKIFLLAITLSIVAIAQLPAFQSAPITTNEVTLTHVDEYDAVPVSEYMSLSLALFMGSLGLFIAGIKLRKR